MSDLGNRAFDLMLAADELWGESRYEDLAIARDIEADAWEEAGADENAHIAREQARKARMGRAGEFEPSQPYRPSRQVSTSQGGK